MARLPLEFEPIDSQSAPASAFITRSGALKIGIAATHLNIEAGSVSEGQHLDITLADANVAATVSATEQSSAESNYLVGRDPSLWKTHIPHYGRVTYSDVYPGVDFTLYGNGQRLEHDFIIRPGADWSQVRMQYGGASSLALDGEGNLHVGLSGSEVVLQAPVAYQVENGQRHERAIRFVVRDNNEVEFSVTGVDRRFPLVIDPVLDFSTFLADQFLYVNGVATDPAGNTYIVGETFSSTYPVTSGVIQPTCASCPNLGDIFVTKLNAAGTSQVYSTYIGGNDDDQPDVIAVDKNGNAVVAGFTNSTDYPLKNPIASGVPSYYDGFVTSLSPDGSSFNFSSRLGGSTSISTSASTYVGAVTTDSSGNVYVTGTTESPFLPVTAGALDAGTPGYTHPYVFLTKLKLNGELAFSALLGDPGEASGGVGPAGVAVDSSRNVFIGGTVGQGPTFSGTATPWPTTSGAYQTALIDPSQNAPFAAKVSNDGSKLLFSTLVGSGHANAMAVDAQGEVVLAGSPNYNFPLTSDAYEITAGYSFIAKVNATGTKLSYSSYFGSTAWIAGMAIDPAGDLWLVGNTGYGFTLVNPLQSDFGNGFNTGYVAELDPQFHTLLFSTYFNGPTGGSSVVGVAVDEHSHVHIAGIAPNDLPTTQGVYLSKVTAPSQPNAASAYGYAAVIDPNTPGASICTGTSQSAVVEVGTTGQGSFDITNCGTAPLTISGIQLQSALFSLLSAAACVETIAPAASCTVNYTFTPTATGNSSAVVVIASNAALASDAITIYGYGTAPKILPISTQVDFPTQVLGITGSNELAYIDNQGTAPLLIDTSKTVITKPFKIVSTTCASLVAPGSGCSFTLSYQPSAVGKDTGSLRIFSNDPLSPQVSLSISGTTLAAYSTPTISTLYPAAFALNSGAVRLSVSGSNFFPASQIVIDGEPLTTTFDGSNDLSAMIDPSLLTSVGELPVTVVNPSPGGTSVSTTLLVYNPLTLSAAGLVYEPSSKLLYISIPSSAAANANTVVSVDPLTGVLGTPIPVGNDPRKLALAPGGKYLYVGIDGDNNLQRIDLGAQKVDRTFALPIDSIAGSTTVQDMHVVPGSPQSVVVSLSRRASPSEAGAALFNDSGLVSFVPNDFSSKNYSIDSFAFTSNPSAYYAFPFADTFFGVTKVSSSGLTPVSSGFSCCDEKTGSQVASDGTLLYTNSGEVWNPSTKTLLGTLIPKSGSYPLDQFFYVASVVPDSSVGRTFFFDTLSNSVYAFDPATLAQTGVIGVPSQDYPDLGNMVRWGVDGFALTSYDNSGFGSTINHVLIFRSSVAHTATGGKPQLTTLTPASGTAGSATFSLTIKGSGFIPGSTVLWNGTARETVFISGNELTALVPFTDLAQAGSAQVTVSNPGGTSSALSFAITGPSLTVSPLALDFGSQAVGVASAPLSVTVTNTGNGPASMAGSFLFVGGANVADFTASNDCGASLAAGAHCALSVIFKPSQVGAESASLTVTATGAPSQVVALAGTGDSTGFGLASSGGGTSTVTAGQNASYSIVFTPVSGFSGTINLACSNLPPHASCSFSPAAVTVSSNAPTTVTLTVATRSSAAGNVAYVASSTDRASAGFSPWWVFLGIPLWLACRRFSGRWAALSSMLLAVAALSFTAVLSGCGGSSGTGGTPPVATTPAGTYTFMVVATSGSTSHSTSLTLKVQ